MRGFHQDGGGTTPGSVHDFTRLHVWQRARALALVIYEVTSHFPTREVFGLTQQMRRCVSSVGANLAEGARRETNRNFARFTTMALGSLNELEHHCFMAADLGFFDAEQLERLRSEIGVLRAMTVAFQRTLRPGS